MIHIHNNLFILHHHRQEYKHIKRAVAFQDHIIIEIEVTITTDTININVGIEISTIEIIRIDIARIDNRERFVRVNDGLGDRSKQRNHTIH